MKRKLHVFVAVMCLGVSLMVGMQAFAQDVTINIALANNHSKKNRIERFRQWRKFP